MFEIEVLFSILISIAAIIIMGSRPWVCGFESPLSESAPMDEAKQEEGREFRW